MKTRFSLLALAAVLSGQLGQAQTNQPVVEDFKASTLNRPGQQHPQVNFQRHVRYRVMAPQSPSVSAGRTTLTKREDSPDTAREFQTWRRSLLQCAPLLFRD